VFPICAYLRGLFFIGRPQGVHSHSKNEKFESWARGREIRILLLEVGENSSKIAYPICENERLASRGGNARAKETPHKQNPGESLVLLPIRRRYTFFRLVFNQVREGLYSARTGITQLPTKTLGGSFRRAVKIRIKFFLCQIN
jgi:hypothetical protein